MATLKTWDGLALATILTALAPASLSAQLATTPDRDNTLYEPASQIEGCIASTSNGAGQFIFSGFTNGGVERRAVLHFDLSSIPPGSTITDATLTLNLNRVAGGSLPTDQFGLRRLTADWGEGSSDGGSEEGNGGPATPGDATWCDRFFEVTPWGSLGGDFASPASATIAVGTSPPALHVWGPTVAMTADVQSWVDAPATNFGWILIQDLAPPRPDGGGEGEAASARRFDSREGEASLQPTLSVTFVPLGPPIVEVPTLSSWGLVLLAGALLAGALRVVRTRTRSS
jgi:hypothetical protein